MMFDVIPTGCRVDQATLVLPQRTSGGSISRVYERLGDGFEVSFYRVNCRKCRARNYTFRSEDDRSRCNFNCPDGFLHYLGIFVGTLLYSLYYIIIRLLFCGPPCGILICIYKYPRRHSSLYYVIEDYLQKNNNMNPIRYSYSDIKKMTHNFKDKLGQGGYGSVYKGKLRSGHLVAVKVLAARGTMGYIAPELFYKNIGGVSFKSDVYSFGMMLIDMASGRKNRKTTTQNSSRMFLPTWVYDQLNKDHDVEIEEDAGSEEDHSLEGKMIIVGLWCVQLNPSVRPSMHKVVEMLEGDIPPMQCVFLGINQPLKYKSLA